MKKYKVEFEYNGNIVIIESQSNGKDKAVSCAIKKFKNKYKVNPEKILSVTQVSTDQNMENMII